VRKAVNENQAVQFALVGILVVVAGFLFMTRIAGGGEEAAPPATTTGTPTDSATETTETSAAGTDSAAAAPSDAAPSAGASSESAASGGGQGGGGEEFVPGPGLPKQVAAAYDAGETVVLLVVRGSGIDDGKLEAQLRERNGVDAAIFVTRAKGIADYSRIAQGVDVDHVPALVVIQPQRLTEGALPEATISYGYRGARTIEQAIRDAGYKGPENLPYYPN
jgi:hypothetical protein